VDMLNNLSRTVCKGWSSNVEIGQRGNTSSPSCYEMLHRASDMDSSNLRQIQFQCVHRIHLDQDRDQCWSLINTVMILRVP
jgi:hypothetical protein